MKITFSLSPASIRAAKQQTLEYEKWMAEKWDIFLSRIAQEGAKAARQSLVAHGAIDTEDLFKGIGYVQVRPGLWKVYAYAPVQTKKGVRNYAWFVEYGTGVVGKYTHPDKPESWDYDSNKHGEDGWFYPYSKGEHHRYEYNPETEKMQPWSKGQPAVPFMYESRQHILDPAVYKKIAKEVFG